MQILWILVVFGCLIGVVSLAEAIFSTAAPQQAAGAAIAVACAVIPYCFARACHVLTDRKVDRIIALRLAPIHHKHPPAVRAHEFPVLSFD